MKYEATTFLLLFIIASIFTKAQNCASLHQGKFRLRDKAIGETIITRNEKYQSEVNADFNIVFSVTWVKECTYELRPIKVIKGDVSILEKDFIISVEIVDIKKHGYKAICTTNDSDEINTFIIERLN